MGMMTILRARSALEMDVDIDHTTEVANIDYDTDDRGRGFMTIYGTEEDGTLYYIVLDDAAINMIRYHGTNA